MKWLGNEKFMRSLGRNLRSMEREARKRNAPVFALEDGSKKTPFRILVYTMLSARTKDEITASAAKRVFKIATSAKKIAKMDEKRIAKLIKPVGFYKTKAKYLKKLCEKISEKYKGKVPQSVRELTSLPGVGTKTAHIVLARAFGHNVIGVDTHVHRISNRLGLVKTKMPEETSELLNKNIPAIYRRNFNRAFVAFGQTVCKPVSPVCTQCKLLKCCKRAGLPPYRNIYISKMRRFFVLK